jgi:methylated-DNA-[protein]-cysteine S-methyltransferase
MSTSGIALFATALGDCGIAWHPHGIDGVQLPEADAAATLARLRRRFPGRAETAMPPAVWHASVGVAALMNGEARDLLEVALDMSTVSGLHRRVYELARRIRPGSTSTYGDLARELGDASLARAVGQALARNPFAPIVPCHRVMAAGGRAGGFSAGGGLATKLRLLQIEGALLGGTPGLFDADGADLSDVPSGPG